MALQHTYSTPQHRCGLPGLPLDIHPEIFWLLSSRDILNYGLTCRAIFRVFEIFVFLRYKRALYKQGLRDNPRSDLALKARWALLLDRTRAWNELKPDGDPDAPVKGLLDLDHIALSPFAFVAGDFTSSPSRPLISRLHFPHRIVESSGDLSFEHGNYYRTPLESPMQNIMQNIKIIGIGSAILEHDSYVYVIRGHDPAYPEVTTVTVGKSDCSKSGCSDMMNLELPLDATISRVAVEVAGENLAVIVQYSHGNSSKLDEGGAVTDLLVIDWNIFKQKLDIRTCGRVSDPGLVFLSEELLLNPSSSSCALNIYSILPTIALKNGTAGLSKRPICSLGLPPPEKGNYFSLIDCKCSPNPTAQDAFPSHLPESIPFTEDPKQAIVVFTISVRRDDPPKEWSFGMVVHRRALLDLVQRNLANTPNSSPRIVIPWNEWGPSIVRWLPTLGSTLPPSWGQRLFELHNHTLHVLNFNPREIESSSSDMGSDTAEGIPGRMDVATVNPDDPSSSSDTTTVQEPRTNIFLHEGAFKDVLIGRLPYSRQKVQSEVKTDSVWFDGVRVLFPEAASSDPTDEGGKTMIRALHFG